MTKIYIHIYIFFDKHVPVIKFTFFGTLLYLCKCVYFQSPDNILTLFTRMRA